jgi:hypothetical protein
MARILIPNPGKNNEWFEQVAPETFAEIDIEHQIILHAPTVYPEFNVLPFKLTVESPYGTGRPDLIFISKDYADWWICEVELGYKVFKGHVENQVQIFTEAKYDYGEASYIFNKFSSLDFDRTLKMFQTIAAKVLVIVNEPKRDWIKPLKKYGAVLGVFEMFRSSRNDEIFRVNGEYPSLYVRQISKCFLHPTISRFLGILEPEELDLPKHGRIILRYNNCITEWERFDADGKVWLAPTGQSFLEENYSYEIFKQGDDALVLRRIES